jgi:peptide chain release factor 1
VDRLRADVAADRDLLGGADPDLRELARAELAELEPALARAERDLADLLVPADPLDDKDAILEIRAGTGGEEAALFAADLLRMYRRFLEARGWRADLVSLSESPGGGIREAVVEVHGEGAYGVLRHESGVHRVQRVPSTEAQGRIHTSAATVAVLPEAEEVEVEIRPEDLKIDVYRSSGPGGQSVNTTDSAVRVTHLPTGVVVQCQDEKSQLKNKTKALRVLRARLLDRRIAELESERSRERRSQVGTGDRSAKIRTYNFPQSRVTDHRIGLTLHRLDAILNGDLGEITEALRSAARAERSA